MAKTIHQGRNIKRIREILGVKQEALAYELGDTWNQQRVSELEAKEHIKPELLEEVAKALKIPASAIENFSDEVAINVISNTFTDSPYSASINYNPVVNTMEKWLEALEANKKLYERLLEAEKGEN